MIGHFEKFEQVILELTQCDKIELRKVKAPDGFSKGRVDEKKILMKNDLYLKYGFEIPEIYNDIIFSIPNKLIWDWSSNDSYKIVGTLFLDKIATALSSGFMPGSTSESFGLNRFVFTDIEESPMFVNYGSLVWENFSEKQKEFYKHARYFDANHQSGIYACLIQDFDKVEYKLNYNFDSIKIAFEDGFQVFNFKLDFTKYFDILAITKGAVFWQFLFVQEVEKVELYVIEQLLKMLIDLPLLFPNTDYLELQAAFNENYLNRIDSNPDFIANMTMRDLLNDYKKMINY